MCSKEEVKAIVNASELRMHRCIDTMQKKHEDDMYKSHNAVSEMISNSMGEHTKRLDKIEKILEKLNIEALSQAGDAIKGAVVVRKVILWIASIIIAFGVIKKVI